MHPVPATTGSVRDVLFMALFVAFFAIATLFVTACA